MPTLSFLAQKAHFILLGTGDAVWYPSARFFTKELRAPWGPVFEDMAGAIREKLDLDA